MRQKPLTLNQSQILLASAEGHTSRHLVQSFVLGAERRGPNLASISLFIGPEKKSGIYSG